MGSITDHFSSLSEVLLADHRAHKSQNRDILLNRLLKPMLPVSLRIGTGEIVDLKDRAIGPFDLVGCGESYPPFGEGGASQFLADGVVFCLQVRDWKEEDLTQFAEMAGKLRAMNRKSKFPLICGVVGFESLPAAAVSEFMNSSAGQAIDGVLSIGQHVMLRNRQGWYGDPKQIPYVTEKGDGPALKAFAFWLVHIAQTFLGIPYALSEYQHL